MKSKKLKKILAVAIASTMVSTIAPMKASAEWLRDSQNSWNWTEEGNKATGWKQVEGTWYYFDASGKMLTGWVQTSDSKWYYLNADGSMKTGWLQSSDGKWYYLVSSGEMKTGWVKDTDGSWYFTDASGAMQTGVVEVEGKIYVLQANGAMATGSVVVAGTTYTIDASGAIAGDKLPVPEKAFTAQGATSISNNINKTTNTGTNTNDSVTSTGGSSSSSSSSHHHSSISKNTNTTNNSNTNTNNNNSNTNTNTNSNTNINVTANQDLSCDQAGTYGPASGSVDVNNVAVNAPGVTLKNMHIKGDLVLGEGIGEGDVHLENVIVDGTTTVTGGGKNSVHFTDSVLATVIVNKNNGQIRIVVEGNSQVAEVQLQSPAKLEESGLTGGATGFNNVSVTDSVQTGNNLQVELVGSFETINSRAENVRIQLAEGTDIQNLVLNVAATVLGTGRIDMATINSAGTILSIRPENMVLHAYSVSLRDQSGHITQINDSYSNATTAAMVSVKLNPNSVKVNMDRFVAGITANDFNVSAKLGGQDYTLQGLQYDARNQRFTFYPVPLSDSNIGKTLRVTVGTTEGAVKVTGTEKSDEITIGNGFSGRITDVQGMGISGVTIKFRQGANARDGEIAKTVVTDEDGYYTAYLAPGQYTGELSGDGIIRTYMYASSLTGSFNTNQNETAIRATAMDSVKIVLTWGEHPRDEDSHLLGPTADGQGRFHTWYSNKIYAASDGIRYADLDHDDTSSYGPETTTIYKLVNGKYRFYVHNFSGEASLTGSGAKVEVYKGSNLTPAKTISIPTHARNQNALYWFVFDMDVSDNGNTINITEINELRNATNSLLKLSDSSETSYVIYNGYNGLGTIQGVPAGTVADLKADISVYDGGALKVLEAESSVRTTAAFDAAVELSNSTALANNQIVAVKAQDGTIWNYVITLAQATTSSSATTSSAVTLEAGSVGVAGDKKITGLTLGNKYIVKQGTDYYGVLANGDLSEPKITRAEAEQAARALTTTEIVHLDNDKTYKVEIV